MRPDFLLIFSFGTSDAKEEERFVLFRKYESLRLLVLGEAGLKAEYSNYRRESISQISPLDWDQKDLLSRLENSAA